VHANVSIETEIFEATTMPALFANEYVLWLLFTTFVAHPMKIYAPRQVKTRSSTSASPHLAGRGGLIIETTPERRATS
jgi:hypothetical protein